MSDKIKKLIKNKGGDVEDNQRPRGMHSEKYQALRSKYRSYQHKSDDALRKDLLQRYGSRAEAYFDSTLGCEDRE